MFPSQYRREKDLPRDPDIFVSYTFSGEWQTVWTTLVVRLWYSQEFKHRELWRNAAEFASPKDYALGLKIDNKQGAGTATISLYFDVQVGDDLKAIFIEYVHRHLARYGSEVSRDRRYVCPHCGAPVKDLDAVRKRLDAKKEFITCQGCDKKVPLMDFIEQRLKSDPVARKILAMDEAATRELDTGGTLVASPPQCTENGRGTSAPPPDESGTASGRTPFCASSSKGRGNYPRTSNDDGAKAPLLTEEIALFLHHALISFARTPSRHYS